MVLEALKYSGIVGRLCAVVNKEEIGGGQHPTKVKLGDGGKWQQSR